MWPYGGRAIWANRRRAGPWSCWAPPGWAARGSSITWSSESRRSRGSCIPYVLHVDNAHGLGFRIEYDPGFAPFKPADDMRHFILKGKFLFPIVRTLTQYVRFDDGVQQIRRQFGVRNHYRLGRFAFHLCARPAREPGIEMPRECIAIRLRQRGRTTADVAAGAHRVHEIAHGENSPNGIPRIALTARIQRFASLGDHLGGERNIGGDDEVPGGHALDDLSVRHIETGGYLNGEKAGDAGNLQRLIGDQRYANTRALGRAEQDLLDDIRTGVRIDPDTRRCHIRSLRSTHMHRRDNIQVRLPRHAQRDFQKRLGEVAPVSGWDVLARRLLN